MIRKPSPAPLRTQPLRRRTRGILRHAIEPLETRLMLTTATLTQVMTAPPTVYGTSVNILATVVSTGSTAPTEGSVDFVDSTTGVDLGNGTFKGSGGQTATWVLTTGAKTFNATSGDTIIATYDPGAGFSGSSGMGTQVVSPLPISVSAVTDSKAYDGGVASSAIPMITSGSIVPGDNAAFFETYDTKNAGGGKILTPGGSVMDGNGGNNYAVTFFSDDTGAISAEAITITAIPNSKPYDGSTTAAALPKVTSGTVFGTDTPGFTETYDTSDTGTGKTLTPAGSVNDGNSGKNYAVTFAIDTTGVITARSITVTAAPNSKPYDGTTAAAALPTITAGSLIAGDNGNFTETYNTRNAGTGRTLTPSGSVSDGNNGKNYAVKFVANSTGVITARSITVTAAPNSKPYDGSTTASALPTLTAGNLIAGDSTAFIETYSTNNAGTGKTLIPSGSVIDGNSGKNYAVKFVNATSGIITARAITVTAAANSKTYDGTTSAAAIPSITAGSLIAGDTSAFTEAYSTRNAGSGKTLTPAGSVADGNGGKNYAVTFVSRTTGVISPRAITVTAAANSRIYDGTTSATTTPVISTGTLAAGDSAAFIETYDTRNVGTAKKVTPSGSVNDGNGGNNYKVTFVATSNGVITPRAITVTAAANSRGYDGTAIAAAIPTVTSGKLVGADIAGFSETYNTANTGTGKPLTPAGSVNDGNGGNNYAVTFVAAATGTITPRSITVTASANSKTYDGTLSAAAIPTISAGTLIGSDTASFTETYTTKNAGTGKTLTPTGSIADGNGGKNYAITFIAGTKGTITPRSLTVTAAANSKTYDGTASATAVPAITSGTLVSGDVSAFVETYDNENAGTNKTLTPSGSVNDGNNGNNYAVTFISRSIGVISPRPITVTAATNSKTYDGVTSAAAIPTIASGTLVTGDLGAFIEAYNSKNTGTGKVLIPSGNVTDGNGGKNYAVTFVNNTAGVINARPITISTTGNSKTYDGTISDVAVPMLTSGSLVAGDSADFTETYSTKTAGTAKTLIPSGSVIDGNGGKNYAVTFITSANGVITPRRITVAAVANSKSFDGTTSAAAIPAITSGSLATGDSAAFAETYDTPAVGTGKTLTPAGPVSDGNSGNNYTVTFVTNTTGVIVAITTTSSVSSSQSPAAQETPVTFTDAVTASSGSLAPAQGSVDFFDTTTGVDLGAGTFQGSSGVTSRWSITIAGLTLNLTAGDVITATYSPGADFAGSSGTVTQIVTTLPLTTTTLQASADSVSVNSPVTFTATVAPTTPGGPAPSGMVNFSINGAAVGTTPVQSDGTAIFTTSFPQAGTDSIAAAYSGDANFAPSTSVPLNETVTPIVGSTGTAKIGGLDPAFGDQGLASHNIGMTSTSSLLLQGDGKSIIIGTVGSGFGVARYNADGSLDTSFGNGSAVAQTTLGSAAQAAAGEVLPNGDVLVAGTATNSAGGSQFALVEYTADGSLDPSFGNGTGIVQTSFSTGASTSSTDIVQTMTIAPNGEIYVAGSSDSSGHGADFAIAAFHADGSPDSSFGRNGKTLLDFQGGDDSIASMALLANGKLVVAGTSANPATGVTSVALARLLSNGTLDASFGKKGTVLTNARGVDDGASSLAITPTGKIVVAGYSAIGSAPAGTLSSDFLLVRYSRGGKLNRGFGNKGIVITSFNQPSAARSVVVDSDGTMVAAGNTVASLSGLQVGQLELAVARYTPRGLLDPTFNGAGEAIFDLGSAASSSELTALSAPVRHPARDVVPFDATSDLMSAFNTLIHSSEAALAVTPAGDLLDVGTNGANTVEASIVANGLDLSTSLIANFTPTVLAGSKGTLSVSVNGQTNTLGATPISIELYTSAAPQLTGSDQPFHSFPEKLKIPSGKSKTYRLRFHYPSSLADGNYYVVASIASPVARVLDPATVSSSSKLAVHIAPPFVSLSGSALTAPVFTGTTPAEVSITVLNDGDIAATLPSAVQFLASPDGAMSDAISLATLPEKFNLKPGAQRTFHLKLALPSTLSPGTYFLLAQLDPANVFKVSNTANNLVVSGNTFTVG